MKKSILFFFLCMMVFVVDASGKGEKKRCFWSVDKHGLLCEQSKAYKHQARSILSIGLMVRAWDKQWQEGRFENIVQPDATQFKKDLRKLSRFSQPRDVKQVTSRIVRSLKDEYLYNLSQGRKPYSQLSDISVNINESPELDVSDRDTYPALTMLTFRGYSNLVALALCTGADKNQRDTYGKSVFFHALEYGKKPLAQLLVGAGADMTIPLLTRNWDGQAPGTIPLHVVVTSDLYWTKKILKKYPEQVHVKDELGRTPLHFVARRYKKAEFCDYLYASGTNNEALETLLQAGAKIDELDHEGKKPVDLLEQKYSHWRFNQLDRYDAVKKLLEEGLPEPTEKSSAGGCIVS